MTLSDLNNLEINNAGNWPAPIKAVVIILVIAIVGALGYYLKSRDLWDELKKEERAELDLRAEFKRRQAVKANINAYRAQLVELQGMLDTMLQQLPTRTEMPDLLEDISNTGKINGLVFELFKPEDEQPKEFYAAKPITIKARATYHQFAAFVSSISALPRIVTLQSAKLATPQAAARRNDDQQRDDILSIDTILQTYRYLDEEELETTQDGKGAKGGNKR